MKLLIFSLLVATIHAGNPSNDPYGSSSSEEAGDDSFLKKFQEAAFKNNVAAQKDLLEEMYALKSVLRQETDLKPGQFVDGTDVKSKYNAIKGISNPTSDELDAIDSAEAEKIEGVSTRSLKKSSQKSAKASKKLDNKSKTKRAVPEQKTRVTTQDLEEENEKTLTTAIKSAINLRSAESGESDEENNVKFAPSKADYVQERQNHAKLDEEFLKLDMRDRKGIYNQLGKRSIEKTSKSSKKNKKSKESKKSQTTAEKSSAKQSDVDLTTMEDADLYKYDPLAYDIRMRSCQTGYLPNYVGGAAEKMKAVWMAKMEKVCSTEEIAVLKSKREAIDGNTTEEEEATDENTTEEDDEATDEETTEEDTDEDTTEEDKEDTDEETTEEDKDATDEETTEEDKEATDEETTEEDKEATDEETTEEDKEATEEDTSEEETKEAAKSSSKTVIARTKNDGLNKALMDVKLSDYEKEYVENAVRSSLGKFRKTWIGVKGVIMNEYYDEFFRKEYGKEPMPVTDLFAAKPKKASTDPIECKPPLC